MTSSDFQPSVDFDEQSLAPAEYLPEACPGPRSIRASHTQSTLDMRSKPIVTVSVDDTVAAFIIDCRDSPCERVRFDCTKLRDYVETLAYSVTCRISITGNHRLTRTFANLWMIHGLSGEVHHQSTPVGSMVSFKEEIAARQLVTSLNALMGESD